MIFKGIIWTCTTSNDGAIKLGSSITRCLGKSDFYGEELLSWASLNLPISTQNVKCHTKVEACSLMAKDLKAVVSKFRWHFSTALPDFNSQLEELALSSLRARRRNRSRNHAKAPQFATDKRGVKTSKNLGTTTSDYTLLLNLN